MLHSTLLRAGKILHIFNRDTVTPEQIQQHQLNQRMQLPRLTHMKQLQQNKMHRCPGASLKPRTKSEERFVQDFSEALLDPNLRNMILSVQAAGGFQDRNGYFEEELRRRGEPAPAHIA